MENPRQAKAIKTYIVENKACENANEKDFDKVAGCTGRMMAELLCFKQDEWSEYLRQLDHSIDCIYFIFCIVLPTILFCQIRSNFFCL